MTSTRAGALLCLWSLALGTGACGPREQPVTAGVPDSTLARALAADRGERLVMPLAPAGSGRVTLQGVAETRAELPVPQVTEVDEGRITVQKRLFPLPGAPEPWNTDYPYRPYFACSAPILPPSPAWSPRASRDAPSSPKCSRARAN